MDLDYHLARTMLVEHPIESARILETLDAREAAGILVALEPDQAARVLRNMVRASGAKVIVAMDPGKAGPLVAALPVYVGGHILRLMETPPREELLARVPDRVGNPIRAFIDFAAGTAGAFMNPDALVLPGNLKVAEARRRIQERSVAVADPIGVVDDSQVLTGVVSLAALFSAPSGARVGSLQRDAEYTIRATAGLPAVLAHEGWRHTHALPVVDDRGVMLGSLDLVQLRRLEDELELAARGSETSEALGDLFRTGINALLGSVLAPPRPGAEPSQGDKS